MTEAARPLQVAVAAQAGHVFGTAVKVDPLTARVAAVIDPAFLTEVGWRVDAVMLEVPTGHRLVTRRVCKSEGCAASASTRQGYCLPCKRAAADGGQVVGRSGRQEPGGCAVEGCAREWSSARHGLCRAHADLRDRSSLTMPEFLARAMALPALEICEVTACARQRRGSDTPYCHAHQQRIRVMREADPGLDEARWRQVEPPVSRGGRIVLRGLAPLVVAEVLAGLQQRCRLDRVKSKESDLRSFVNDLRSQQVTALEGYVMPELTTANGTFHGMVTSIRSHARRALASPETEVGKDCWDLMVFGHRGTVNFTVISQGWLRETAKRWAADDLPKRRVRVDRVTSGGLAVRHHIGCLARLSQSLRMRPDRGEQPSALGRGDMEAFLHRLAYLESVGQITNDARIRACREVRAVLARARAMGLTRPGAVAAGLGEDFAIHLADVPVKPEPGEAGRDLPPEIMRRLCGRLDDLTSSEMRTAVELAIDTGRRPEEIASLPFDCLARDGDGAAVLVYDNHKANRAQRRLPISETTAKVIIAQQRRVRNRFPDTSVGELKLLPTDRRNPDGRKAITAFSFGFQHRSWVERMPTLTTSDGVEFDKALVVLYAYRHTYAQRHADAGVPIDVLRELMDHRKLDTTKQYYRVGENRRREAVDRVSALQFDRHGNRIWRQAQALLDSEHVRRSVGEVAVPFGICAEPSNVKAGGNACPYRFRCAGCDHFRTDVSYLPDLQAYLDDLLRNRERVLAATDVEAWARTEALPSTEEITRIRRLINRIHGDLADLDDTERADIDRAIAAVRRHRTTMLGMPRLRPSAIAIRPEQTA
ncbi:site-specific integrase [Sphaerisporangium sp. NPDC088356]|uniref:tyrosine-type recombinase/integrase n=1 Tax=Sphaerisporangium sp. NPDC088356 TaxID=3154871 RepID=UPI003418A58D